MRIDLNADLGEGVGDDESLLGVVTSANIATGAHAGGGPVLDRAVAAAVSHGVAVGAHPSYPDRAGFGRRSMRDALNSDDARQRFAVELVGQVLEVVAAAERRGVPLSHVKPHGALYNDAARDPGVAEVVVAALRELAQRIGYPVALLTLPRGELALAASRAGIPAVGEGFADRAYLPSGALVPRDRPGAVHCDPDAMVGQARALAAGRVTAVDGTTLQVRVGSLCVHGDTPGAVSAARAVRGGLAGAGWTVAAPHPPADHYARVAERLAGWVGPEVAAEVHHFGDRALLVRGGADVGSGWVRAVAGAARTLWPGVAVQPGLASVLVGGGEHRLDEAGDLGRARHRLHAAVLSRMRDAVPRVGPTGRADAGRTHSVPTRYDGPDLADVAGALGLGAGELADRHARAVWTVAAVGFSPGFGYLTANDPLFAEIPRRADPRRRVPAGAVAVAAGMSAVYPSASPGGWQLIGRTDLRLFDAHSDPPALLSAGDQVRFVLGA